MLYLDNNTTNLILLVNTNLFADRKKSHWGFKIVIIYNSKWDECAVKKNVKRCQVEEGQWCEYILETETMFKQSILF